MIIDRNDFVPVEYHLFLQWWLTISMYFYFSPESSLSEMVSHLDNCVRMYVGSGISYTSVYLFQLGNYINSRSSKPTTSFDLTIITNSPWGFQCICVSPDTLVKRDSCTETQYATYWNKKQQRTTFFSKQHWYIDLVCLSWPIIPQQIHLHWKL